MAAGVGRWAGDLAFPMPLRSDLAAGGVSSGQRGTTETGGAGSSTGRGRTVGRSPLPNEVRALAGSTMPPG
jgi:hypothetical protein